MNQMQCSQTPTMSEVSKMLDCLLEVQRVLTRARDHKRLALLSALTGELQDDYLLLLARVANGSVFAPDNRGAD
jgi:hypothetical protein